MVKYVGMPVVFWIGSVWAGAWTALLAVVLLSALLVGLALESIASERRADRGEIADVAAAGALVPAT